MVQEEGLNQAIALIKAGNNGGAVPILKNILKKNRNDELAWFWLSACADNPEDKIFCFQQVLRINPNNKQAKEELEQIEPPPIPRAKIEKTSKNPQRKVFPRFLIPLLIIVSILFSIVIYFYYGPCGVARVNSSKTEGSKISKRWDDENQVVSKTARIALSGPITEMQKIKRDMSDLEVPACLSDWKNEITSYMDNVINGYLAFMGDQSDPKPFFDAAKVHFDNADQMWIDITHCSPFCISGK
jgi:tetratricopeptide (TPR) repeat protein